MIGFSPFRQTGSQVIWYRAEMHEHSCTLSVSMHIETVSRTQNIIHPPTVLRVMGLQSSPHKQKKTAYSQLNVHRWSQSSASSALVQGGKTCQSQNYQHLHKGLSFQQKHIPQQSYAVWHVDRARIASVNSMTREQNCSTGVQSSCHVGILRHGGSWPDRHVPWRVMRNSWDCMVVSKRPWALVMEWSTDRMNISTWRP